MKYITNSIDKIISLTNKAFNESKKCGDNNNVSFAISEIYAELRNVEIALKMMDKFDEKLDTFDLVKYGKLLDLIYEIN